MLHESPVVKYALFYRQARPKDGGLVLHGPFCWTLYKDRLHDTFDSAVEDEQSLLKTFGHETAIREVVIERPPESLFDAADLERVVRKENDHGR